LILLLDKFFDGFSDITQLYEFKHPIGMLKLKLVLNILVKRWIVKPYIESIDAVILTKMNFKH